MQMNKLSPDTLHPPWGRESLCVTLLRYLVNQDAKVAGKEMNKIIRLADKPDRPINRPLRRAG